MFWYHFIFIMILLSYIYFNISIDNRISPSSSLISRTINGQKYFHFKNICYSFKSNQFIFLYSNKSYIYGIKDKNELKNIDISAIKNHNKFKMKIAVTNSFINESFKWIDIPSILLWRFKPDNLLHLFHDDLIPLFATLRDICDDNSCIFNKNLVFLDCSPPSPYDHWYSLFSKYPPINLANQNICFRDLHVGLKQTYWYQYGFNEYHGPVKDTQMTFSLIREFADFIKIQLNISKNKKSQSLLITRPFSRRILNEDEVKNYIEEEYKGTVKIFKDGGNSLEMVKETVSADLLIGMHGAAMAMAIFLPLNATVIELFPFGINYMQVSAIYALSILPENHFRYFPWTNINRSATVTHPDYPELLGGIEHLSKSDQEWIQAQNQVPEVKCCHDPNYLYHMFQDTFIDSSLKQILHNALHERQASSTIQKNDIFNHWYFPAPVYNISCSISNNQLYIKWNQPINYIPKTVYRIFLLNGRNHWSIESEHSFIQMNMSLLISNSLQIWISSLAVEADSLDEYKECVL